MSCWKTEVCDNGAKRAEGFPFKPIRDFVFVLEYGQPNKYKGSSLYIPNSSEGHWRYLAQEWRVGEVVAVGPGYKDDRGKFRPAPDVNIGDVVLFSRRHGTRLPEKYRFTHPKYSPDRGMSVRILDAEKCLAVFEGFEPWWDVAESSSSSIGSVMSG